MVAFKLIFGTLVDVVLYVPLQWSQNIVLSWFFLVLGRVKVVQGHIWWIRYHCSVIFSQKFLNKNKVYTGALSWCHFQKSPLHKCGCFLSWKSSKKSPNNVLSFGHKTSNKNSWNSTWQSSSYYHDLLITTTWSFCTIYKPDIITFNSC